MHDATGGALAFFGGPCCGAVVCGLLQLSSFSRLLMGLEDAGLGVQIK